ncbi:hypothetical protein [Polaribacter glomeratus]|uniref:Uncharacterized protein n=1 Tax=Polaribacter glomeratus TaxID=102 RepID=A0A2S7WV78_9FLAO|nr:hypothetical protein [Polaribacter glomeratus]PQJ81457.1 hypothetical protein BTO16_02180 [Polaribacter glomeratus]TXD64742.1 hypothetical protein ESX12_13070 [Polaribacter glomeratus]
MLYFKCFIFSLILWLSFTSSLQLNEATSTFDRKTEIKNLSNNINHQALIVDAHLEINSANWSGKTSKIPNNYLENKLKQPVAETYNYKLVYLAIGNRIPLKLTSKIILFPFHFFT